jgi:hypothetical protein
LQELGDGHWISVSRGPPEDIVDAWGDFTDSLDVLKLSDAEMQARDINPLTFLNALAHTLHSPQGCRAFHPGGIICIPVSVSKVSSGSSG